MSRYGLSPAVPNGAVAGDGDRAVAYADRIIDRQLNKARGVLTFDSILVASSKIGSTTDRLTMGMAALSALICLVLLWVYWGSPSQYQSYLSEVSETIPTIRKRTFILAAAIALAIAATIAMLAHQFVRFG